MEDDSHVFWVRGGWGDVNLTTPSDPNLECPSVQFNTSGLCQTSAGIVGGTRPQTAHSILILKAQDHMNLSSVVFSGDSWNF